MSNLYFFWGSFSPFPCDLSLFSREISHSSFAVLLEEVVCGNWVTPQPLFFQLNKPSNSTALSPSCLEGSCQISWCGGASSHPQFVRKTRIIISQMQNAALALFLFNVIAQLSNLSRALSKASLSLREFTAPPSLVWLAKWLNLHLAAASRSLIQILKDYLTSHLLFYFQYLK